MIRVVLARSAISTAAKRKETNLLEVERFDHVAVKSGSAPIGPIVSSAPSVQDGDSLG